MLWFSRKKEPEINYIEMYKELENEELVRIADGGDNFQEAARRAAIVELDTRGVGLSARRKMAKQILMAVVKEQIETHAPQIAQMIIPESIFFKRKEIMKIISQEYKDYKKRRDSMGFDIDAGMADL